MTLLTVPALVALVVSSVGTVTLNWYINPDSGGQDTIAAACSEQSDGRYRLRTYLLPRDSPSQREQLVRRLAANDTSIDIMSIDPPYIPEFAEAGFLVPLPPETAEVVTEDVVPPAVESATWRDELVAAPFWANTQLLWYRQSVAEAAGLDLSQPVTWEQLIATAQEQQTTLAVQGIRSESMTVWLNALVESAGGSIVQNPEANPDDVELGLREEPAAAAAEIINTIATQGLGGPVLSTANEDTNATAFETGAAGFMVNWPFVWARAQSGVEGGTLDANLIDDIRWAVYPRVTPDQPSAPPLGGIGLGVGSSSPNADLAFEALECITSEDNQAAYMITDGNPASKRGVYTRPEVVAEFPAPAGGGPSIAETILTSLEQAAPRPQTPYYSEVSGGIQRTYHPPSAVDPGRTGDEASELIQAVLRKERLL